MPRVERPNAGQFVLSYHKYLPVAILYFFLNSAGLPTGLFYTTLLSPILAVKLYQEGKRWMTAKFLLGLSPFIAAHLWNGIGSGVYYARSTLLLWTVFITVYAFLWGLAKSKRLDRLFDQVIVLNFCAALVAVVLLPTPFGDRLWNRNSLVIEGAAGVTRLQLLTSEPSVYAQLMAPLLIFAVLRIFDRLSGKNIAYALLVVVPFLLSQSFGGLSICATGLVVALLAKFYRSRKKVKLSLAAIPFVMVVAAIFLVPNPILSRIGQVAAGTDSSTQSRTTNGFLVSYIVAASKSIWWGVGLGQSKLNDVSMLGLGFRTGVVPNSIAGTLAELGLIAVLIKLAIEIYLFFRVRVYGEEWRLAMFVIAFLYQFTGSTLMNVQEYLMWGLAFGPVVLVEDARRSARRMSIVAPASVPIGLPARKWQVS